MKPRLILLNAPPRSGKDTFVELFATKSQRPVFHYKFAEPIRAALESVFYPPLEEDGAGYERNVFREDKWKDTRVEELGWETPREAMIRFSEDFMKPFFGSDVFPKLLWEKISSLKDYQCDIIVSDLGFSQELGLLTQKNFEEDFPFLIYLVHIHRQDMDFKKDSRDWVQTTQTVYKFVEIYNNGTLDFYAEQISDAFEFPKSRDEDGEAECAA